MTLFENWLLEIPATGTTGGFLSGDRWVKDNPFRTAKMREWRKENQLSQSRTRPEGLGLRERQRNQKEWRRGKALPRKTQQNFLHGKEREELNRTLRLKVWMTARAMASLHQNQEEQKNSWFGKEKINSHKVSDKG